MKVLQFPLARVTLVFIVGIVFTYYTQLSPKLVFSSLFIAALFSAVAYFWCTQKPHHNQYFGPTIFVLAFAVGMSTQTIHTDSYQKNHFTQLPNIFEQPHTFTIVLKEKLKSTANNQRYVALVNQVDSTMCSGKLLLNINKDSLHHSFIIGNRLQIQGSLYPNMAPKNPFQFDYGTYLKNKQIYGKLYANATQI
ncbi:MAG: hypothetical protein RLZZ479_262, partial [Bacteroidota bacterium]